MSANTRKQIVHSLINRWNLRKFRFHVACEAGTKESSVAGALVAKITFSYPTAADPRPELVVRMDVLRFGSECRFRCKAFVEL